MTTRPEMTDIIEEAAIHLGVGAGTNVLLRGIATLLFMVAQQESQNPRQMPLSMLTSAFDISVEYLTMAARSKEVKDVSGL